MPWRLHRPKERGAGGESLVGAAGLHGGGVVLAREREVGAADGAAGLGGLLERVRGMQLVHHVAVDVDEVAAVRAGRYVVGGPDLVEQGRDGGHFACVRYWCP